MRVSSSHGRASRSSADCRSAVCSALRRSRPRVNGFAFSAFNAASCAGSRISCTRTSSADGRSRNLWRMVSRSRLASSSCSSSVLGASLFLGSGAGFAGRGSSGAVSGFRGASCGFSAFAVGSGVGYACSALCGVFCGFFVSGVGSGCGFRLFDRYGGVCGGFRLVQVVQEPVGCLVRTMRIPSNASPMSSHT